MKIFLIKNCVFIFYLLWFSLLFIFMLCDLGLYKVSLQVPSPHMIFHCKYQTILFLLVYIKICKIMLKNEFFVLIRFDHIYMFALLPYYAHGNYQKLPGIFSGYGEAGLGGNRLTWDLYRILFLN